MILVPFSIGSEIAWTGATDRNQTFSDRDFTLVARALACRGNSSNGRFRMKTAVLMVAVLLLAPLPTLGQEVQRTEDRAPSQDEKGTDRETKARTGQPARASDFHGKQRQ